MKYTIEDLIKLGGPSESRVDELFEDAKMFACLSDKTRDRIISLLENQLTEMFNAGKQP
jgi:hypothetical protein